MKKLIPLLILTLTLACHADIYFPGAWYSTKQPLPKQAGAIEVTFYTDHTLDFDIYVGGGFVETVEATYVETVKFFIFTLTDSDGWTWTGKLNKVNGQLLGTFHSLNSSIKGKFQCARADDGQTTQ